ncbi:zinc finger, DNL-type, Mitochondrial import protein TIM15 [Artemisia annua]|uniref:Zinc finger, DNL-type, Mitochondrial import protein TIM15 n=1 Tax=Artemisia annua TaxID=35608 RepID=A0A2U1P384_ARTAN|nr:zinc finger, DNL-type, Mitochondrial import protein TIM15 [Artemisia annua]
MGLVLSAANVRGWTTGSGMEGPPAPADDANTEKISTFPWSLFTKSPRRRMRVAFTCNVCGQRTTRAINPHAYTDGTVFVQLITKKTMLLVVLHDFRFQGLCDVSKTWLELLSECCGCNIFHKLVDNLNLFHEMKCYVSQSFNYQDPNANTGSLGFKYLDMDDESDDIFPIL